MTYFPASVSRVSFLAAFALFAASGPTTAAQGLDSAWRATIDSSVVMPGEGVAMRGRGDVVATVSLVDQDTRTELRVFDTSGLLLWARYQGSEAGATLEDLELSEDGATVFVLLRWPGQPKFLQLSTYDAQTGAEGWTQYFFGFPPLPAFQGQLEAAGGRVAVLASDYGVVSGSAVYESRVTTLATSDGSVLSTSAPFALHDPSLHMADSGLTAVLWSASGAMAALDTSTGAAQWSVAARAASPAVRGVAFSGSETVVARAEETRTVGFDAANGAELWGQDAVEARAVAGYAQDRFFVCGPAGGGSVSAGWDFEYGMLDAATGAVHWNTSQHSAISTPPLVAVDPDRNRVAFRAKDLFVIDATTGASVGSGELDYPGGEQLPLSVLADGTWVGANGSLDVSKGRFVEAFDSDAKFLWMVKAADVLRARTRPDWIETRAAGARVHLLWEYEPLVAQWPVTGNWEVRSSSDGSIESSWPWVESVFGPKKIFALDPSGTRLATLETPLGAPRLVIETVDALTGAGIGLVQINGAVHNTALDVVWAPSGQRFAAGWVSSGVFRVAVFNAAGQMLWTTNVPVPGATSIDMPALTFVAVTGDVLATIGYRSGTDSGLSLTRLAGANGASLGHITWGVDFPFTPNGDHRVVALHPNAATARTYAVVAVRVNGAIESVWTIAIHALAHVVTAERMITTLGTTVSYAESGSALTPDSSALLVAGTGPLSASVPTSPAEIWLDALDLPDLTPRFQSKRATGSSTNSVQVAMVNSEVAVLRYGWGTAPQNSARVELIDMTDGDALAELDSEEGLLTSSIVAASQSQLLVFGKKPAEDITTHLHAYTVASLLAGPQTIPTSGSSVDFVLNAGPVRAGAPYMLLGSMGGVGPKLPILEGSAPLVFDAYTSLLLQTSNTGPFAGTHGSLDNEGTARARIDVPSLASLAGLQFHHVGLVLGAGGGVDFVSKPAVFSVQD